MLGPVPGTFGVPAGAAHAEDPARHPGPARRRALADGFHELRQHPDQGPAACGMRRARLCPDPRAARARTRTSRSSWPRSPPRRGASSSSMSAPPEEFAARPTPGPPPAHGRAARGPERLGARGRATCCCVPPASAASTAARELRKRGFDAHSLAGGLQALETSRTREHSRRDAIQEQVAGCRHDHLHRHVAPCDRGRGAQHRPGIPGLSDRSATSRRPWWKPSPKATTNMRRWRA